MPDATPASSYTDPTQGSLSSITDPAAAKEIGKLWNLLEGRFGATDPTGDHVVVTKSDLDSLQQTVANRIDKLPSTLQGLFQGGGSTPTGNSNGLLRSDNVWIGAQQWQASSEALGTFPYQFTSVQGLQLQPPVGIATILLNAGYQATVDLRKVSSATLATSGGGNAVIYLQHRIDDSIAHTGNVHSGIRCQVESFQKSMISPNDVAGIYVGLHNHGVNTGGFGVHVDLYHNAIYDTSIAGGLGGTISYGMNVECFRGTSDGEVVAFHARVIDSGVYTQPIDAAFLASPSYAGSGNRFKVAFGAGSPYIGTLHCDIGLDLSYATCDQAAIKIPYGKKVMLNAPALNVGFYFDPQGWIQFFSDVGNTFRIDNNGDLHARSINVSNGGSTGGSSSPGTLSVGDIAITNPNTGAAAFAGGIPMPAGVFGFWYVNLGGFQRAIPFF